MKAKIIPPHDNLLLPYQAKWINDNSRLKLAEKSRQIGWTWATACGLVLRKCLNESRYDCWISSRDELQAKLYPVLICLVRDFCHAICAMAGGPRSRIQR